MFFSTIIFGTFAGGDSEQTTNNVVCIFRATYQCPRFPKSNMQSMTSYWCVEWSGEASKATSMVQFAHLCIQGYNNGKAGQIHWQPTSGSLLTCVYLVYLDILGHLHNKIIWGRLPCMTKTSQSPIQICTIEMRNNGKAGTCSSYNSSVIRCCFRRAATRSSGKYFIENHW